MKKWALKFKERMILNKCLQAGFAQASLRSETYSLVSGCLIVISFL
jgi:hypothetical protein